MNAWTPEIDGDENNMYIPDDLMPLFNRLAWQLRLHTISDLNENAALINMVWNAQKFFSEHPELLIKKE